MDKELDFSVEQGAVIVSDGYIVKHNDDVALLEFDLQSKYADLIGSISGDEIELVLSKGEHTLHANPTNTEASIICIRGFIGFDVFSAEVSRYTLRVALVKY